MASQITSLTIVYRTAYSGADQRKHQSSASLAFVRGIHRWPVNSPRKGPVTRKMFPFDDVIMSHAHINQIGSHKTLNMLNCLKDHKRYICILNRILDFWYSLGHHWKRVITGLGGWAFCQVQSLLTISGSGGNILQAPISNAFSWNKCFFMSLSSFKMPDNFSQWGQNDHSTVLLNECLDIWWIDSLDQRPEHQWFTCTLFTFLE